MLSVDKALQKVLEQAEPLAAVELPLPQSLGRVLASDVVSDIDSPPCDKALVDGYAVIAADLAAQLESRGSATLRVLEEVVAGATPALPVAAGAATRIMTGAPMPRGADAVVMIEQTELVEGPDGPCVRVSPPGPPAGRNFLKQGASFRRGETVLASGRRLRSMEIGLLAEVGRVRVSVVPAPRVALLSTGDELVDASQQPGPGQIRNSNGPMLAAQVAEAGAVPAQLGVARDDRQSLAASIAEGLRADVLVLSGGVSAGVLDLVPSTLASLGVKEVFHKVRIKPGKPLWFGTLERQGAPRVLVFGLPGNPVSSLVCFHLFVRPALAKLAGDASPAPAFRPAALTHAFDHRGDRPTYFPAVIRPKEGGAEVTLTAWKGSADLRSLCDANGLAYFPEGDRAFHPQDPVGVLLF